MGKPLLNDTPGLMVEHRMDPLIDHERAHAERHMRKMIKLHLEHDAAARLDERCNGCEHAKLETTLHPNHFTMEETMRGRLICDLPRGGCPHEVRARMGIKWPELVMDDLQGNRTAKQFFDEQFMTRPAHPVDPDVPENYNGAW